MLVTSDTTGYPCVSETAQHDGSNTGHARHIFLTIKWLNAVLSLCDLCE